MRGNCNARQYSSMGVPWGEEGRRMRNTGWGERRSQQGNACEGDGPAAVLSHGQAPASTKMTQAPFFIPVCLETLAQCWCQKQLGP